MSLNRQFDALNFFLADVRGGLGPYVGVYLLTKASWSAAEIGAVLTVSGLIGICLHAPIGAFIDQTRAKRALIASAVLLLATCAVAIEQNPTVPVVATADIVMAGLGAIFAPTVAAITLGATTPDHFSGRIGRNAVWDRIGNVFIASTSGTIGWWLGIQSVFYLVPILAFPAIIAVLSIPAGAIDHERARGLPSHAHAEAPEHLWSFFLKHGFFLTLCAVAFVFHFGNASMMPLVAQKLAIANPGSEAPFVSACILVAQFSSIGAGVLVAHRADTIGHERLLVLSCTALASRGLLFSASDNALLLVSGQVLDGLGIGLFDTLLPLLLADSLRSTGRYNLGRGVLGAVQGVGGSLSNIAAGAVVVVSGYSAAFLLLGLAGVGAGVLATRIPRQTDEEEVPNGL